MRSRKPDQPGQPGSYEETLKNLLCISVVNEKALIVLPAGGTALRRDDRSVNPLTHFLRGANILAPMTSF